MYFLIEDEALSKKYNNVWNKVTNSMKKEFDNTPIYHKIFLKSKIKFSGEVATDVHDKEISKAGSNNRVFCSYKR